MSNSVVVSRNDAEHIYDTLTDLCEIHIRNPLMWPDVDRARQAIKKSLYQEIKEEKELLLDDIPLVQWIGRELYEFQQATGCDTAHEYLQNMKKE